MKRPSFPILFCGTLWLGAAFAAGAVGAPPAGEPRGLDAVAAGLLREGRSLSAGDANGRAPWRNSSGFGRLSARSPEERRASAKRELAEWERVLAASDAKRRFDTLPEAARAAYEAGEITKAAAYAREALDTAPRHMNHWSHGHALHHGNLVLGRIALAAGRRADARNHLKRSGDLPESARRSGTLSSFGPDMTLARELLETEEREAVIDYLESCKKFWACGKDRLEQWIAEIRSGGSPQLGGR